MQSAVQIKDEFNNTSIDMLESFIEKYIADERKSVQAIISSAKKRIEKEQLEKERLVKICEYENKYYSQGMEYIAGIDEVGRGPFAGPVLTAAVILPRGFKHRGINDSKKLSEKKREELFDVITQNAVEISVKMENNNIIDEINILNATLLSMSKTINSFKIKPDVVLVDALTIPGIDIKQEKIIKGDAKSISIAAASIIAKVTRDRIMKEFAQIYPEYGFERNSGYGTAEHIKAIEKYGLCPIHRKTFASKFVK